MFIIIILKYVKIIINFTLKTKGDMNSSNSIFSNDELKFKLKFSIRSFKIS